MSSSPARQRSESSPRSTLSGKGRGLVPADVLLLGAGAALQLATRSAEGLRPRTATVGTSLADELAAFRRGVVVVVVATARDDPTLETVARVRRRRSTLRALLVNPTSDVEQRLLGLSLGFDEAVPQEMGAAEIAGRIGLLADRLRAERVTSLPVAEGVELDLLGRTLRRNGRPVHLRPLEFRLLEELALQAGRPVSRAWLFQRVWGSRLGDGSRTVDVHVRWLREKLERYPDQPVHLLTIRGVGYQLEPGGDGG